MQDDVVDLNGELWVEVGTREAICIMEVLLHEVSMP
jgi:hypothetical protein